MSLLRFASLLVLALWVGGLATLATLGPTIFTALESLDPDSGRVYAGQVFGTVLQRFQHIAWGLGGALLALYGLRAALGPRPRRLSLRMWTATAMLATSLAGGLLIGPRIDAIRRQVPGPIAGLVDGHPSKVEFGRLHGLSNALMLISLLAGVGLIWVESRDPH